MARLWIRTDVNHAFDTGERFLCGKFFFMLVILLFIANGMAELVL